MPLRLTTEPPLALGSSPQGRSGCTDLIDELAEEGRLTRHGFVALVAGATPADREYARRRAVAVAHEAFGNRVFVRSLIEFSDHCRRDCLYCGIRKANREAELYRLDARVPGRQCVRVREGGEVLQRVDVDRGAFACMLGGEGGTSLFIAAAEWKGMDAIGDGSRTGQILVAHVDVPHAGRP